MSGKQIRTRTTWHFAPTLRAVVYNRRPDLRGGATVAATTADMVGGGWVRDFCGEPSREHVNEFDGRTSGAEEWSAIIINN